MRIFIVGGGPAGLYFAILTKRRVPAAHVTIVERDGPHDTFGWGIVFSDQTFSYLSESDRPSFERIVAACERWENVAVVRADGRVSIGGNRFSGIARIAFLKILRARCDELGVESIYHRGVGERDELPAADLIVGADGANSTIRRRFAGAFGPSLETGANTYIWLGTPQLFHALTLTFRTSDAGVFAAHSYKFSPSRSTFIVECGEETWRRAGLGDRSEADTTAYLEQVFADDLAGQPLLTNDFVRWVNFLLVKNARWRHGNVVLLGDALHTAHFSIGSGTKLALEDAIALDAALAGPAGIDAGLERFERERRPVIEEYQDAAQESRLWFERAGERMGEPLLEFAYGLMTRSRRIDREKLRRRDPAFVDAYERSRSTPG
jgi:anthraniloyl-CoA monooxygenase